MTAPTALPVPPRGRLDGSVDEERLWEALSAVEDPELPVSVVDLGLVRELDVRDGQVRIGLTYTSLACPCVEIIRDDVRDALAALPGVTAVTVDDVLEPWSRDDLTPAAVEALRVVAIL
ncbi:metal-sulfur cluster assembly factor [Egicoccus sp. AB-alg2]|uniref:metal-sulfur cluster assembly factor n=1 Tax=Egicoccus sp. AB-alg2 TaxID=3242693 RepID=UPI00359DD7AE